MRPSLSLAGSASGFLRQGVAIDVGGGWNVRNINKMLNAIGSAGGLRSAAGAHLDDFGDPKFAKGLFTELMV